MLSTDLVAELRAEVSRWYENMQKVHQQKQQQMQQQQQAGGRGSLLTPILGAMLGDGPIRLITGGQELPPDIDDKSLAEMQFKDHQVHCYLYVFFIPCTHLILLVLVTV